MATFKISRTYPVHQYENWVSQTEQIIESLPVVDSILYWGAKGDGITDNTAVIGEAITYVAANGGSLYFPTGNYVMRNSFSTLSSNAKPFVIYGDGPGSKIIVEKTTSGSLFFWSNINGVEFRDLYFDGGARNGFLANLFISIDKPKNCVVDNCTFYDIIGSAVFMFINNTDLPDTTRQYRNNHIRNCFFDANSTNIAITTNAFLFVSLSYSTMTNCTVINQPACIGAFQFKNSCFMCNISDCNGDNVKAGITFGNDLAIVEPGCQYCVSTNCSFRKCYNGILIFGANDNTFTNIVVNHDTYTTITPHPGYAAVAIQAGNSAALTPSNNNNFSNIIVRNYVDLAAGGTFIVDIRDFCNNNQVNISNLDDTTAAMSYGKFATNCTRNVITYGEKMGGFDATPLFTDFGTLNRVFIGPQRVANRLVTWDTTVVGQNAAQAINATTITATDGNIQALASVVNAIKTALINQGIINTTF